MKTVLITGGSRGIGAACAKAFAAAGYAVMIGYHKNKDKALFLQEELVKNGAHVHIFQADVGDSTQAKTLVQKTMEIFGGVDVLVNNAGIAMNKMFCDTTEEDWNRLLSVNLLGPACITKEVLPYMVHQKSGHIINVSSVWGLCGASCEVAYSATKAALIGMTKALAKELGPSGILVNCVAPGVIDTDMNKELDEDAIVCLKEETPLGRPGTPEEVAKAILFLAEGNTFITGQVLSPNGGFVM